MYKLMIVDDEPLVQVAIMSMIDWEKLGIRISATARNGREALELIAKDMPDIVITDIKMPVMDGLEFIAECKKLYEDLPAFIVLTNYDEFNLVQQALRMDAVDYIIKLDLNKKILEDCIKTAVKKMKKDLMHQSLDGYVDKGLFTRQFLVRLLNGYYTSNEHIERLLRDLSVSIEGSFYCVVFSKIIFDEKAIKSNQHIKLYSYVVNMTQEIMGRQYSVTVIPVDTESFAIIVAVNDNKDDNLKTEVAATNRMIKAYFNVKVISGVGNIYYELICISKSYNQAMQAILYCSNNSPVTAYNEIEENALYDNAFDISAYRQQLIRAFEELNIEQIEEILDEILTLINNYAISFFQALDACCSILYLLLTVLDSADEILEGIFDDEADGYRCIYRLDGIPKLADWLEKLKNGLVCELNKRKNSHSNYLVVGVKNYIHNNYTKKLSLQEVASIFNVSPNYLSTVFKKYTNTSFSNYVAKVKIKCAEEMLKNSDMQIYEISEHLGFNDPYYFSRVFKRITGYYPKQYRIKLIMGKK